MSDKEKSTPTVSAEMQAIEALQKQFKNMTGFALDDVAHIYVTLQVILDLQRAILAKLNVEPAAIDEMCMLSRNRAKAIFEQEISDRLKLLSAQNSGVLSGQ